LLFLFGTKGRKIYAKINIIDSEEYAGMPIKTIGSFSYEEFLKQVKVFHGHSAPGVVLGGIMVDRAMSRLPPGILFDAIAETGKCLPDAIQLLTPCTIGNGWLRIHPWGRFALALYDKQTGEGIRAVLDTDRLEASPEIKSWYYKLKPKEETDSERLLADIREAGTGICRLQKIQIQPFLLAKEHRGKRAICPRCREAYPDNGNGFCPACLGAAGDVYCSDL
jgi:formylmethanofuran dehydrogenase subunit E